ncbi:MAG: PAS domain S-box protein, partial [Thermodesulfovibrionales bacterium]|nr:PAS domain S-box protein [Thermodesulfovibrionales bacterium]
IAENAEEWIWEVDADGLYTYSSPIVQKILGYAPEEIVGNKHLYDFFSSDSERKLKNQISDFINKKIPFKHFVNPNMHKNGRTVILETSGVPIFSNGGNLIGYRGAHNNITELKHAEKALKEGEERFRLLVEGVRDYAIFMLNPEGFIMSWNKGAERIIGYRIEEAINQHFSILYLDEDIKKDNPQKGLKVAIDNGTYEEEGQRARKDGSTFWASVLLTVLSDENENLRGFSIVIQDITERKHTEARLQRAYDELENRVKERTAELRIINTKLWDEITERKRVEEDLRETELRYRTVADFTNDWEYWETPDGKLSYVSPSCYRITGYEAKQFIESPHLISEIMMPEDRKIMMNHRHEAFKKQPRKNVEFRIKRQDGKIRWIEHICQSVTGIQGQFLGVRASNRDITIRKHAEEELKNTLSLLNATLESTTDGILVVDKEGKILSFNKKFVLMWNIPKSIIESRNDEEALAFVLDQLQEPESFLGKVRELYKQPEAESYDILAFKDGKVFERYSQPQKIGASTIGRVWSFRDITERKQAEDRIRENEEKYRQLFIAETDSIIVFDAETQTLVDVNNAALSLYGYSYEEFLTMKRKDISVDPSVFEKSLQSVLSGKVLQIPLLYHKKKDGSIFPVEICASSFTSSGHKMVFEVIKDITVRKKAQDKLKESEEKFRAIADYTHDWESWIGKDGQLTWVNSAVERMTGYLQEECLKMKNYPLPLIFNEDRKYMANIFESALLQKSAGDIEFRLKRQEGSIIWASMTWQSIYDDEGNWIGYRTSTRDITERKKTEEALKKSHANLRALSAHITKIEEAERLRLSRELHDQVGQKLTALSINLEFLIAQLSKKAKAGIVSRLDDSKGLVKEIMKLVRHIMTDLRPQILDDYGLKAALHWYSDQFAKRTNIPVVIKGKTQKPRLPLHVETNLFRIIQESLTNIAKYSHASNVTITLNEKKGVINLTITDNGIGFDPVIIQKPGKVKGLGLIGMQERAKTLNGNLQIDSSPGKGTQISIEIRDETNVN